MSLIQTLNPKPFYLCPSLPALNPNFFSPRICPVHSSHNLSFARFPLFAASANSDSNQSPKHNKSKPKPTTRKTANSQESDVVDNSGEDFPATIPRKPRRGRRSEAAAVEDFVRNSLERTFESIRKQNSDVLEDKEKILKDKVDDREEEEEEEDDDDDDGGMKKKKKKKKKMVVEVEDPNWPLDADVGWGIRASEYFEKHAIRNVVGEDGVEIDWEGEIDDNYVKEINCLEWESFAFHPSPLIVLVFERYRRATDNWKLLKELEKAVKVYWNAKDRLPPRTVKIDINIERDLAYALKVREGPELLFLRGNKILYREKETRTTDELIHLIAHFYYNAKRPSWINTEFLAPYY